MAIICGGNELQANTVKVVGTYSYMSPEYAMQGNFLEKSDVFSFGVLLLEVVTGKKNTSFYDYEESLSLLGYTWKLWKDDRVEEIVHPDLSEPCFRIEILILSRVGVSTISWLSDVSECMWRDYSWTGTEQSTSHEIEVLENEKQSLHDKVVFLEKEVNDVKEKIKSTLDKLRSTKLDVVLSQQKLEKLCHGAKNIDIILCIGKMDSDKRGLGYEEPLPNAKTP
ncbi:hypothetical protein GIB67_018102 [Kingdonia uniflora]|uniref:Protein kinase domain-containing protein n=1 Tax=Kingdonia uniflora TaxID=39325 RepID=A0A7J7NXE2_9MAGN|nr:hypothetical protein GIB67_018102 [Kingdonia uniflora]